MDVRVGLYKKKNSWARKNWWFWTVVLEKSLESPLVCKEIQPVHPKGNQSWIFIGRTDAEAKAPILWPPDGKNWLTGKNPDAGKDWGEEEKGMTEDEMVGWHNWVWASSNRWWWTGKPGMLCSPWGHRELDTTERLNWTESQAWQRGSVLTVSGVGVGVAEDGEQLVPGGRGGDDSSQDGHRVGCVGPWGVHKVGGCHTQEQPGLCEVRIPSLGIEFSQPGPRVWSVVREGSHQPT